MTNPNSINTAIRDMAKSVVGGHATMATMLGLSSKTALENRIYGVRGQSISIDEAMLMQRFTERTDFAQAVAHESGGVFIPLPPIDAAALAGEDITEQFMSAYVELGELTRKWRNATQDGSVCGEESAALWQQVRTLTQRITAIAVLTDQIYGAYHAEKP